MAKDKLNFIVRNCVHRMLKVLKDTTERSHFRVNLQDEPESAMIARGYQALELGSLRQLIVKQPSTDQHSLLDLLASA